MKPLPMHFNVEVIERDDDAAWAEWQDSVALHGNQSWPVPLPQASSSPDIAELVVPLALVPKSQV